MELTVLMENEPAGSGLRAEHGLCLYGKTLRHTILMDTGASDAAWENAAALGCELSRVDIAVISHGHYDHTGGLMGFSERNPNAEIYLRASALGDFYHGEKYIGADKRIRTLPRLHRVEADVFSIDEELTLFAGISGRRLWPSGNRELTEKKNGLQVQDSFDHEQCLVVHSGRKHLLFSGCAHNGILNILDRYRAIFGGEPDVVISGFHMQKQGEYTEEETENIRRTALALRRTNTLFYTGHCTGEAAFAIMKEIMGEQLQKLRVGSVIRV